jgi:hypothetical protein
MYKWPSFIFFSVPKSVAFEVLLDDKKSDSLVKKHPPMRIKVIKKVICTLITDVL